MRISLHRIAIVALTVAGSVLVAGRPAGAATGTFTAITSPASEATVQYMPPGPTTATVSGTASADVTGVDIYCVHKDNGGVASVKLSGPTLPVSGGTFSGSIAIPSVIPACRLKAIPTGVAVNTDYIGAFTGPVLRVVAFLAAVPSTDFEAVGAPGDGIAVFTSAASVGVATFATIQRPAMEVGANAMQRAFAIGPADIAGGNSALVVDGHPSYLPAQVKDFLITSKSLPVTQSLGVYGFSPSPDGSVVITESSPVMRCSAADTYPPTLASCPSVVDSGVRFERVLSHGGDGHTVLISDRFVATAPGAHVVTVQYQATVSSATSGNRGYHYPNSAGGFAAAGAGQVVPAATLGTGAGTMLIRSDLYAAPDSYDADTIGFTWSRPPSSVAFASVPTRFGLGYTLGVPAGGATSLEFAESETLLTSTTQAHADAAAAGFVRAPAITAPASGARIGTQTTTVTGTVSAGANGLPTSVTVNGRAATLTATGPSTATYSTRLTLGWGRHTITVTARDVAGNAATSAVAVTNTPTLAEARGARERGTRLTVPVVCQSFSAGICTGKIIVRSARGALLGKSAAFSVRRGRSASVPVTLRSAAHVVRVYLYQREPTGAYVLASVRTLRV